MKWVHVRAVNKLGVPAAAAASLRVSQIPPGIVEVCDTWIARVVKAEPRGSVEVGIHVDIFERPRAALLLDVPDVAVDFVGNVDVPVFIDSDVGVTPIPQGPRSPSVGS